MPLKDLDTAAVARAFAEVSRAADDPSEVFLEAIEDVAFGNDPEGPTLSVRRELGLAARITRGGRSWLASRDAIRGRELVEALRQVARSPPSGLLMEPAISVGALSEGDSDELVAQGAATVEAIRSRHAAFPLKLSIVRRSREIQVVGRQLAAALQRERYYSLRAETPWGRFGSLETSLTSERIQVFAATLVERFRAREAPPPRAGKFVMVLSPQATAVLLHEAVGHALEVDTLARSGRPEAAIGVRLGGTAWSVLDDPTSAPEEVRRESDDEGLPARRRWLLREGVVEEPLADARAARDSETLTPGAGRRASRHAAPVPRSSHLELLPGETRLEDLLAGSKGGIYAEAVSRGSLEANTGVFRLTVSGGHRINDQGLGERVGEFEISGSIASLLQGEVEVGSEAVSCGAGWCAKDGHRLPVWARCPAIRLGQVEVVCA
jgi:hypothetical protein